MKVLYIIFISLLLLTLSNVAYAYEIFTTKTTALIDYDNSSMPTDIIISKDKTFQVYDSFIGRVTTYKNNKKIYMHESADLINGVSMYYNNGRYFFAMGKENLVRVYDSNFKLIKKLTYDDGKKKFDPTDIIIVGKKLYIVDNNNHRIITFNQKTYTPQKSVGSKGSELSNFRYPFSITVDNDSFLFVTDVLNARVSVISNINKIVQVIGKFGVDVGELYRPTGIAIYRDKYLLISDGYLGVIQVFDRMGRSVGVLGDKDKIIKKYSSPSRVRVNADTVGVVDSYDRVVEIFTIDGLL